MNEEINIIELTEENIESIIYNIRGLKVMLDFDLAKIYGYSTKAFNQQVKRNKEKFPDDFMFQLNSIESEQLARSQIVTARIWTIGNEGGRTTYPYAFTEQGIYMLMTVLKGELAIKQSIALIRLFKSMKDCVVENKGLLLNTNDYIESKFHLYDKRFETIENNLEMVMKNFIDPSTYKHILIFNDERIEADVAYQYIYSLAKQSIIVVDDYIDIKTLELLKSAKEGVEIVIATENKAKNKLTNNFINDFVKDTHFNLKIIKNNHRFHDRFIILDFNTEDETVYHCGTSSKDAGNKVTAIMKADGAEAYHSLIEETLKGDIFVIS